MQEKPKDNIFDVLKNLFSTDVIIRNVGNNQLKVVDTNKVQQTTSTNDIYSKYNRLHRSAYNAGIYNGTSNYQTLRVQIYTDYEAMDTDSIISSTLDILSDECTLKSEMGEVLRIKSSNENIQKILYNLFYDILNIEFNLWTWIRNMCKYGDFYLFLQVSDEYGVYNVLPLSSYDMIRIEGSDPTNPSYVYYQYEPNSVANSGISSVYSTRRKFENFEIAHFRLLTDTNFLPYGRSYIEPARKSWKQLTLMEDAMLIHRITRAPEKRIFYVDVGSIPPNEIDAFMQKIIQNSKKTPFIDEQTGEYNLKFNVQNTMEDFYIPTRGGNSSTKIETLKGLEYNAIEDVNYLRDKMLAALKVPKAFFGYEADLQGKATLAAEDIRFARTIERLQRIIISELTKIALIHLYVQGYKDEGVTNFELELTSPSIVYEKEKVMFLKDKVSLAQDMLETNMFPSDYIYDNVFNISEDQYDEMRDLTLEDKKRKFRLEQIENEGNDPAKSGKSFGTKHDVAALWSAKRVNIMGNVPPSYDENKSTDLGRPPINSSDYGTQDSALGRDPIGQKELTHTPTPNPNAPAYKGGSPLALNLETKKIFFQNKDLLGSIDNNKKKLIFEEKINESDLLDEKNIIGI